MQLSVETWSPEYGSELSEDFTLEPEAAVDLSVETPWGEWTAITPPADDPADSICFLDGVRRLDARIRVIDDKGAIHLGLCASISAGSVHCANGRAEIKPGDTRRRLLAPLALDPLKTKYDTYHAIHVPASEGNYLSAELQRQMAQMEQEIARNLNDEDHSLIVIDGPLRSVHNSNKMVGYIKSHRVSYLPPESSILMELEPGQRTPVFLVGSSWRRFSWYIRLPSPLAEMGSGIARCEARPDLSKEAVINLANQTARTLPVYASTSAKDSRAPQNLYPIGRLEKQLRHRLGSRELMYRALRMATSGLV